MTGISLSATSSEDIIKSIRHTDWALVPRVFTFGAGAFELDATNSAGVVGFFGEIPLPLRHSGYFGVGDLEVWFLSHDPSVKVDLDEGGECWC